MKIEPIVNLHEAIIVINRSFETVANEYGYSKETVLAFPAFMDVAILETQVQNGLQLFGLFENEILTGTIGYRKTSREGIFQIERLAVLPTFRHKQFGRKLMQFVEYEIIKLNGSIAEVEIIHENIRLKNWYKTLGFEEIRIDHYDHLPFAVEVLQKTVANKSE